MSNGKTKTASPVDCRD